MPLFILYEDNKPESRKKLEDKLYKLIDEYENKLNEQLSTETIQLGTEEFIEVLEKCLKECIRINDIYPGINDYDDDCDY